MPHHSTTHHPATAVSAIDCRTMRTLLLVLRTMWHMAHGGVSVGLPSAECLSEIRDQTSCVPAGPRSSQLERRSCSGLQFHPTSLTVAEMLSDVRPVDKTAFAIA